MRICILDGLFRRWAEAGVDATGTVFPSWEGTMAASGDLGARWGAGKSEEERDQPAQCRSDRYLICQCSSCAASGETSKRDRKRGKRKKKKGRKAEIQKGEEGRARERAARRRRLKMGTKGEAERLSEASVSRKIQRTNYYTTEILVRS